jgi:hypothetical protein
MLKTIGGIIYCPLQKKDMVLSKDFMSRLTDRTAQAKIKGQFKRMVFEEITGIKVENKQKRDSKGRFIK